MIKDIINSLKKNQLLILLPLIPAIFFSQYLVIFLSIIVVILLYLKFDDSLFLFITIFTFLTLTSTLDENLRLFIQIFNYGVLGFLFFKHYGLDFKNYPVPTKLFVYVPVVFISIMLFSTVFSNYPALGFEQIFRTILFFILIYLYYGLLLYNKDIYTFIISLSITGLFFACLLIYSFMFTDVSLLAFADEYMIKLTHFFVHKNTLGVFFTIVIIFFTLYSYYTKSKVQKYFSYFVLVLLSLGLITTNSRSSIMVLFVGLVYLFFQIDKRLIKYFFISAALFGSLFLLKPVRDFAELYMRFESFSTGRDLIYETVFKTLPHVWLTGSGPAATKYYFFEYSNYLMGSHEQLWMDYHIDKTIFGHAHNYYLYYFTDLGILGFIFSVLFPIFYFIMNYKVVQKTKLLDKKLYYISIAILTIGITFFLRGMLEWGGIISYGTISLDLPFWLLLCLLDYFYKLTNEEGSNYEA